jgi:aryl-alcohol dehydrogenase-like predicted oxidoreductase
MERVDLYQLHYPLPPVALESWVKAMLSAMQSGWIDAIGISNCSSNQMLRAHELLLKAGAALTSNQVEYHLLNRSAETVGLLKRCKETGITLISYSPLAMGILSGKYSPSNLPAGIRGSRYNARTLARIQPLITLLHQIGADRGGKTAAQTAINWVICKGALPIPGAKDRYQAEENAGAAGWRLTDDEVAELDAMSDEVNRLE